MRRLTGAIAFAFPMLLAVPASAELVFFNTGRTLSVKSHRLDGDALVLVLRNGGEMVCEASIVARFASKGIGTPTAPEESSA